MLIGLNKKKALAQPASAPAENALIIDINATNFESAVLKASMDKPVIIDFWAPWCGPCRQLIPNLEKAVTQRGGKVILAKVNVDENPELSQAFRIQSVPTVIALYQGAPVSGFAGAKPMSEIEHFLDEIIAHAGGNADNGPDLATLIAEAAHASDAGDFERAQTLYGTVLQEQPGHAEALFGLIKVYAISGHVDQAEQIMTSLPDELRNDPEYALIQKTIALVRAAPKGEIETLEAKIAQEPDNWDALFELAEICFAKNQKEKACDALISIISRNKEWNEGKARTQLLAYFESWGFADPASVAGRKKLSKLLFS
ncbi:MAG: thioredoxin [Pseudobdellovibrionaceae bacterium]